MNPIQKPKRIDEPLSFKHRRCLTRFWTRFYSKNAFFETKPLR